MHTLIMHGTAAGRFSFGVEVPFVNGRVALSGAGPTALNVGLPEDTLTRRLDSDSLAQHVGDAS